MSENPTVAIGTRPETESAIVRIETTPNPSGRATVAKEEGTAARIKGGVEAVIAVATIIYAFGYLSWAFHAWTEGFGVAPALEGQYFGPGLVLGLMLGLVGLFYYGLLLLLRVSAQRKTARHDQARLWLQGCGVGLIGLNFVAAKVIPMPLLDPAAGVAGIFLCALSWFFSADKMDRLFARGMAGYLFIGAAVVVPALLHLFVTRVFVHLPAELGGPATRIVQLDLKKTEVSLEMLELLAGKPAAEADIVRTNPVRVLMVSGDFYVVRLEPAGATQPVIVHADAVRALIPSR